MTLPDSQPTAPPARPLRRRIGTWLCPVDGCKVEGQVMDGAEQTTDLAAHLRIVHPDRAGHPSLSRYQP